jgi:DNA-directed RNA polymerase subunit H (RpoH/RPB5)
VPEQLTGKTVVILRIQAPHNEVRASGYDWHLNRRRSFLLTADACSKSGQRRLQLNEKEIPEIAREDDATKLRPSNLFMAGYTVKITRKSRSMSAVDTLRGIAGFCHSKWGDYLWSQRWGIKIHTTSERLCILDTPAGSAHGR